MSSYVIGTGPETSERIFGINGAVEFEFLNQKYSISLDHEKGMMSYDINELDGQGFISGHAPLLTDDIPFHLKFLDQTKKGLHTLFCRVDLGKP